MGRIAARARSGGVVGGGLLALGLAACVTNPATGGLQLSLIGEGREIEMGREGAAQVEASIGLYQDDALQDYVSEIGLRMAAVSERAHLPWRFRVVEDPVINAFALPGGFIYVARGILANFNSEAELAAVLGHEIGHVTARHSVEQISRAQLAQIGFGLGSIFAPEIASASDFVGLGLNLLFLKYGRDAERQSDELGLRYMGRVGYDKREMVSVFTMLERTSEARGGSSIPTWLSTHPDPGDRLERTARLIHESGGMTGGIVRREQYLRRIDGLVFGKNPRLGYFREELFLHPELEFQVRFPDGWKTRNLSQAVVGVSPRRDALIQLTIESADTPDDAARDFFSQSGVDGGVTSRARINGLTAVSGEFRARSQQGTLAGVVTFVRHGGNTYQLLGYTSSRRFRTFEGIFRSSFDSFERLTDRSALAVRPKRVRLVTLDEPMTIERFAERYPSTVSLETLALINGVGAGETLQAGRTYKRVVGEGVPTP